MRETPLLISGRSLVGVLCQPDLPAGGKPPVLFISAGTTHRAGPNRLYATLSRRLADSGYPSVRFDLQGIGDSPPVAASGGFRDSAACQVREAMDHLTALLGARRFLLFGLCGGANIAFDVAADDVRVGAAVLINGAHVDADRFAELYHAASRRTARRFYMARALSPRRWARLVVGRSGLWKRFARTRRSGGGPAGRCAAVFARPAPPREPARCRWARLSRRGVNLLLVYSQGSVFWDVYRAANRHLLAAIYPLERLTVAYHKGADHTFTLPSSQDRLAREVERWLQSIALSAENVRADR